MTTEDADNTSSDAFSEDILKIEISGPKVSEASDENNPFVNLIPPANAPHSHRRTWNLQGCNSRFVLFWLYLIYTSTVKILT